MTVPADLQELDLRGVRARDETIALDWRHLLVVGASFDGCTFSQRRSGPVLTTGGVAAQGSLGATGGPSVYRRCRFVGVRFKTLGGFSLGAARFEDCAFERCRWNGHFHHDADLVDCTFAGPMDGCVWQGRSPSGRRNAVTGNDFTGAVIGENVGWRSGLDLDAQRWPEDYTPVLGDP
ncbi:hypothetical protein GCM10009623_38830 [Nocardioides aestuarii]|uniref:Pentapeptide repeat-containing protein n=1 Tax=Nocardioides aestuarii TaxID=252231 RepID=A0ABW4TSZ7_9ACTN